MTFLCRYGLPGVLGLLLTLGGCVAPGPGPDTLANSGFGEGTRVGVMVYVGGNNVISSTGEFSFVRQDGRQVITATLTGEPEAGIEDPAAELGPYFADLLNSATGAVARPVTTSVPYGNPGQIAKREGPGLGVDAVLFLPLVGTTYFTPSERSKEPLAPLTGTAEMRHELVVHARLWTVEGVQLWEGELGQSDRRFGGYLSYQSETATVATQAEFFEQLNVGFDGYMSAVRETGKRVIADLAEDAARRR